MRNSCHLKAERAKEEALLIQSAQRNKASSQTARASQSGFWRKVERINNSKVLRVINDTGDAVAHTVLEMINPVTLVENAWDDSHASVQAYREGHVLRGMALTGKTALDLLGLVPLEGLAVKGVQYGTRGVSAVGSRLGFFGRGAEGADGVVQLMSSRHPLVGLSKDNVIRLVDELGLATSRDQLVLWSGLGQGAEGVKLSQQYVAKYGGVTLEMTPGGKWLNEMDLFGKNSPFSLKQAGDIWSSVSKSLTHQASGQVRALLGQVRPQSIYMSQEILELQMNSRVLGIDEIYLKPKFDTILSKVS